MAATLELGTDESYYWLYSQNLQWNYFDHPPMVAVWIRLFTGNLWLQQYELFVRLGSIAGGAFATWFIYKTCALLHSERAGWAATCLYNASFYAGITAGLYSMPDAPLMVFWTLCLWMLARITKDDRSWTNWILFGISAGLSIMSKAHGVFIWGGLSLYILFKRWEWLTKPQLYVALLLSITIASPIIIWNLQNDFITYRFHSQRVSIRTFPFNSYSFYRELLSQLFFNNPFNVALIFFALLALHRKKMLPSPALSIYNFIGLPLALLFLFISPFISRTMAYWSGPAYITLLPLAAVWLTEVKKISLSPHWLRWSLVSFTVVLAGWMAVVHYYPGTFGTKSKAYLGQGDITLDMYGWRAAGSEFATLYKEDLRKGLIPVGTPVVCPDWWGAHQDYYFCRPTGIQMIGLGPGYDIHHYLWTNRWRKDKVNFSKAYCIVPSDERDNQSLTYSDFYDDIDSIAAITVYRNGKPAHNFSIYRLQGWKNKLPVVPLFD